MARQCSREDLFGWVVIGATFISMVAVPFAALGWSGAFTATVVIGGTAGSFWVMRQLDRLEKQVPDPESVNGSDRD